jgi:hypothetical protein
MYPMDPMQMAAGVGMSPMMGGPLPPSRLLPDPAQMQQMAVGLQDPLALAMQSRGAMPGPLSPMAQILLGQATDQGQMTMQPDMLNQLMMMIQQADAALAGGAGGMMGMGQTPQMMPNPAAMGGGGY